MCTVSWLPQDSGYWLFSSRDEKKSRTRAYAPRAFTFGGVRCVAPIDPEGGGAWVLANQFGVTLCLLNGAAGKRGAVSRGQLVLDLAASDGQDEVAMRLQGLALSAYAPFTLTAIEPGRPMLVAEWNGHDLAVLPNGDPMVPLSSSSLDAAGASRARARLYRTMRPTSANASMAFHASHWPEPGPLSPCMHRDDAATVSFTAVHVNPESIRMTYYDGPLCSNPRLYSVHLDAPCLTDCLVHAGE